MENDVYLGLLTQDDVEEVKRAGLESDKIQKAKSKLAKVMIPDKEIIQLGEDDKEIIRENLGRGAANETISLINRGLYRTSLSPRYGAPKAKAVRTIVMAKFDADTANSESLNPTELNWRSAFPSGTLD